MLALMKIVVPCRIHLVWQDLVQDRFPCVILKEFYQFLEQRLTERMKANDATMIAHQCYSE